LSGLSINATTRTTNVPAPASGSVSMAVNAILNCNKQTQIWWRRWPSVRRNNYLNYIRLSPPRVACAMVETKCFFSKPAVGRFGIERQPYTESCIDQFPCVRVCVWLLFPNHWTDLHKNYTTR